MFFFPFEIASHRFWDFFHVSNASLKSTFTCNMKLKSHFWQGIIHKLSLHRLETFDRLLNSPYEIVILKGHNVGVDMALPILVPKNIESLQIR